MTTESTNIVGLKKVRLDKDGEAYLLDCVSRGKTWFVTRSRESSYSTPPPRALQGSGETRESVMRTFNGWRGHSPALIEVKDGAVIWHTKEVAQ